MTIQSLSPSLTFNNGTCAGAIALYERALGAKVEQLVRFSDAAKMGQVFDESLKDHVLHATLRVGPARVLVMDAPPERAVPRESSMRIFLELDDPRELERSFALLSEGGTVTMPVSDTFWGARAGMLQDAFGVRWMLSHERAKST